MTKMFEVTSRQQLYIYLVYLKTSASIYQFVQQKIAPLELDTIGEVLEMNTIREIEKINNEELALGLAGTPASWHAKYSQSAWVYVGNLDHELSEGDVLCMMSQFGEVCCRRA